MDLIASSLIQLGNEGKTLREERNDKDMQHAFSWIYHGTSGTCVFLFLILDAKIPKFITYVKFEKKTDIKLRNDVPPYLKTGHFKTIQHCSFVFINV